MYKRAAEPVTLIPFQADYPEDFLINHGIEWGLNPAGKLRYRWRDTKVWVAKRDIEAALFGKKPLINEAIQDASGGIIDPGTAEAFTAGQGKAAKALAPTASGKHVPISLEDFDINVSREGIPADTQRFIFSKIRDKILEPEAVRLAGVDWVLHSKCKSTYPKYHKLLEFHTSSLAAQLQQANFDMALGRHKKKKVIVREVPKRDEEGNIVTKNGRPEMEIAFRQTEIERQPPVHKAIEVGLRSLGAPLAEAQKDTNIVFNIQMPNLTKPLTLEEKAEIEASRQDIRKFIGVDDTKRGSLDGIADDAIIVTAEIESCVAEDQKKIAANGPKN